MRRYAHFMDRLQFSDALVAEGVFQAAQLFKTSMNLQQHSMTAYAQKRAALTTELTEYLAKALDLGLGFPAGECRAEHGVG